MTSDHIDKSSIWKSLVGVCIDGVWIRIFNMFVSSMKRVRLQCQKCSSLHQHKTRSLLAINVFVCSVISYSKVSSRGYLVASDDAFVCSVIPYSEVKIGLTLPPPTRTQNGTETKGNNFLKNFVSSRDGAGQRQEWESLKNPTPTSEQCRPPLWPPIQCTCIPSSLWCVSNKVN